MDLKQLVTKKPFYISERKEFISCDLRPNWRISLLLLILRLVGRGSKASRNKIHIVNWALKNEEHAQSYLAYIENGQGKRPFINLDPTMDKAIDYALYSKLLSIENNRVSLTEDGIKIANKLKKADVFNSEKRVLEKLKQALTEDKVKKALEGK
ncbi:hypothetical protein [Pseudoalteromonas sp. JSTW]|uniref:hypothetical protein n=1 Tax=Pseudoalteromonas sp. JSTW TaxID=2752475 RepID=UPI0015D5599A|nr:hypothetical protein [Pseudoalteromonas sp. JSTW]QLJ07244.1 hypothetical protein GZH31_10590 [Pseudoalteromonas sp. JSTW]